MASVRSFVAVLLSEKLRGSIAEVQEQFRQVAPSLKWVPPWNLHVTLKFLGNVEEEQLGTVYEAARRAAAESLPFELVVAGAGAFPNPRRPRVVWVGLNSGAAELAELAANTESELESAGFPRDERAFKAHITIGRAKNDVRAVDLSRAIEEAGEEPLGAQMIASIAVMKSDLRPSGPIYTPLLEVALGQTAGGES